MAASQRTRPSNLTDPDSTFMVWLFSSGQDMTSLMGKSGSADGNGAVGDGNETVSAGDNVVLGLLT